MRESESTLDFAYDTGEDSLLLWVIPYVVRQPNVPH
jgi:hypothetical protein